MCVFVLSLNATLCVFDLSLKASLCVFVLSLNANLLCKWFCCIQAILKTGSNLLSADKRDAWKDLPQATQAEAATRLVSTVENSAYKLADTMAEGAVEVNVNVNIGKAPSENAVFTCLCLQFALC